MNQSKPPLVVVAAALVDAQGRVFVQQRPHDKAMGGLWEFPGGKVEPDETPEAALIRELREELTIETETACLAPASFATGMIGERPLLLLLYVCRKWQGVVQPTEAPDSRWLHTHQLFALDMPPADAPLVAMLDALL
ncbi:MULTISPECIES: (deoxy)nucleoside triphosphate pyrophosphohydrolase [unclassified Sphingobium]|uniref:(deoxy)nucleoside triphosphate pyrophosphohydrolase n=1 Tax=unclassified Sphingobium TaxID=2611147 RepID=UPI0022251522|nr:MULTISPECIES: (deoxy)nucleoside triphosphate pyrophosphohydrolase [unclassified Sphingobium]MCW2350328.1 8-oxo-dGTP diphosphatase [Sphingobium sp. B12D2B]MCW2369432.1 8-oxo-dGTP diphosphatase [Sphingobium sp. B11D3D]MCW2394473.1 8-oxo-dGTP diphosphatase [Sphingobium sp. B8D3B]MCW2417987.1 8-oxo-dGTP diphosphatase [Sphingobium sp. B8D3C]